MWPFLGELFLCLCVIRFSPQIHYWEKNRQNETEKELVLFVPDTSVHLKNLTSYTNYLVRLSAFNTAGDGPLSAAREGRTLQAGESHWDPVTLIQTHERQPTIRDVQSIIRPCHSPTVTASIKKLNVDVVAIAPVKSL